MSETPNQNDQKPSLPILSGFVEQDATRNEMMLISEYLPFKDLPAEAPIVITDTSGKTTTFYKDNDGQTFLITNPDDENPNGSRKPAYIVGTFGTPNSGMKIVKEDEGPVITEGAYLKYGLTYQYRQISDDDAPSSIKKMIEENWGYDEKGNYVRLEANPAKETAFLTKTPEEYIADPRIAGKHVYADLTDEQYLRHELDSGIIGYRTKPDGTQELVWNLHDEQPSIGPVASVVVLTEDNVETFLPKNQ